MRLKEDKHSWRAGGVITRDARHDKSSPESTAKRGTKKDTKKWCRGVVGREHKAVWGPIEPRFLFLRAFREAFCIECGKRLLHVRENQADWFKDPTELYYKRIK